jgi:predicted nucleic acid-binding protein
MPADVFLDTNILIYAVIADDLRTPVAERLLLAGGTISVQVLNEVASVASRKYLLPWEKIRQISEDIRVFCGRPLPITESIHDSASALAARYGFHSYDSLILASALDAGCRILYTEDLQHNQQIEGLTIVNPLLASPTN